MSTAMVINCAFICRVLNNYEYSDGYSLCINVECVKMRKAMVTHGALMLEC